MKIPPLPPGYRLMRWEETPDEKLNDLTFRDGEWRKTNLCGFLEAGSDADRYARKIEYQLASAERLKPIIEEMQHRIQQLEKENAALKSEAAQTMMRTGDLLSEITFAAFGTREAMSDEQLVNSLQEMRVRLNLTNKTVTHFP